MNIEQITNTIAQSLAGQRITAAGLHQVTHAYIAVLKQAETQRLTLQSAEQARDLAYALLGPTIDLPEFIWIDTSFEMLGDSWVAAIECSAAEQQLPDGFDDTWIHRQDRACAEFERAYGQLVGA